MRFLLVWHNVSDIAVQLFVKFRLVISNRKAVDTVIEAHNAKYMLSLFCMQLKACVFFLCLFLCFVALQMDSYDGPFLHPAVLNRLSQLCKTCFDMVVMVVASEITAHCTLSHVALFSNKFLFYTENNQTHTLSSCEKARERTRKTPWVTISLLKT